MFIPADAFFMFCSAAQPQAADQDTEDTHRDSNIGVGYLVLAGTKKHEQTADNRTLWDTICVKLTKINRKKEVNTGYIIYFSK